MLDMKELISQPEAELRAKHEQLSGEIFELRNELRATGKLVKPHELKEKKKDRARLLTALNKKHLTCQEQCQ